MITLNYSTWGEVGETPISSDNIISMAIDPTKFIDNDFYSYEGKRCKLTVLYNPEIVAIFNQPNDDAFFMKNFYQYADQMETIASEKSKYIKKFFVIRQDNEVLFAGIPDYNSYSRNYAQNTIDFELVDLSYVLFENFEDNSDLRAFLGYLKDNYGGLVKNSQPNNLSPKKMLKMALDFSAKYPIDISANVNTNGLPQDSLFVSVPEFTNIYYKTTPTKMAIVSKCREVLVENSGTGFTEEIGLNISSDDAMANGIPTDDIYTMTMYSESLKKVFWVHYLRYVNLALVEGVRRYIYVGVIDGLNNIPNENVQISSYNDSTPFGFCSFYDYGFDDAVTDNDLNYNILSTNINVGNFITNNGFQSTMAYWGINKFSYLSLASNPNGFFIESSGGVAVNYIYKIYLAQQKIDFRGQFYFWYNLALNANNQVVLANTNGIFNPDKFDLKEFFKIMCISTIKFTTFAFNNNGILTISLDDIPVTEQPSTTIPSAKILSFDKKQEVYQLQKQLDELNFAETDRHYVLYAIKSYLLSILQPTAYKISAQLLLDNQTNAIAIGDVIQIDIEPEDIYMVNSVEKDKINYTVSLELIKLKRVSRNVLDISYDKLLLLQQYSYGD